MCILELYFGSCSVSTVCSLCSPVASSPEHSHNMSRLPVFRWVPQAITETKFPDQAGQHYPGWRQLVSIASNWGGLVPCLQARLQLKGPAGIELAVQMGRVLTASTALMQKVDAQQVMSVSQVKLAANAKAIATMEARISELEREMKMQQQLDMYMAGTKAVKKSLGFAKPIGPVKGKAPPKKSDRENLQAMLLESTRKVLVDLKSQSALIASGNEPPEDEAGSKTSQP